MPPHPEPSPSDPNLAPFESFSQFEAYGYCHVGEVVLTQGALRQYRAGKKPAALIQREAFNPMMRVNCAADAMIAMQGEPGHPAYPTPLQWPRVNRTSIEAFSIYLSTAPATPFTLYARSAATGNYEMCAYAWTQGLPLVDLNFQELDPTQGATA